MPGVDDGFGPFNAGVVPGGPGVLKQSASGDFLMATGTGCRHVDASRRYYTRAVKVPAGTRFGKDSLWAAPGSESWFGSTCGVRSARGRVRPYSCRHCCVDGSPGIGEGGWMKRNSRSRPTVQAPSAFTGFRFLT